MPAASPATIASPTRSVPRWTSMVATGPRPTSRRDSTIGPDASAFAFARRSSSASATSRIFSRSSGRFVCSLAETAANCVSPPQSSGWRPSAASSVFTRSVFASATSILLIATTIGTSAARAWLIDSFVCGITPSSAATTSTAMSVTFAPRARMAVKASWPGVSRNVSFRPSISVWYAPMCWVIPPASVSTTAALRIASSSVVLPWSTWPMIVTTGGRAERSASASSTISGSLVVGRVLDRDLALDLGGDQHDLVVGEGLGRRAHLSEAHQRLDDLRHRDPERGGEILDRDPGLDRDGAGRRRRRGSARRRGCRSGRARRARRGPGRSRPRSRPGGDGPPGLPRVGGSGGSVCSVRQPLGSSV